MYVQGNCFVPRELTAHETKDGSKVARFSVGFKERSKKEKVTYLNCVAFGNNAEKMLEHVKKGSNLNIVADLTESEYKDKEGNDKKSFSCIILSWSFLPARADRKEGSDQEKPDAEMTNEADDIPF